MLALEKLKSLNDSGDVGMEIITKAKKSCTTFQKPGPRKPGRGRPPKKGDAVHLKELFVSHNEQFRETGIELYGKTETIRYYCIDLLWGQKLYQELRFVLVERKGFRGNPYALFPETFFPTIKPKARIIHNTDNSEIAERARRTVGFSGFLVV